MVHPYEEVNHELPVARNPQVVALDHRCTDHDAGLRGGRGSGTGDDLLDESGIQRRCAQHGHDQLRGGRISNPANGASFEDPLWEGTDNGVFSPGDIPPGITFVNSCSTSGNLILAGVGFDLWGWSGTGGFPSKVLMPAGDACSLKIIFTPPVDAVALDIFAESDDGFRLSVYGFAGTFTRHIDGTAGQTSPGFIGVTSDLPIGNVVMKAPSGTSTGAFEAADRISFGDLPLFADGFESHDTSAWSTSMGD